MPPATEKSSNDAQIKCLETLFRELLVGVVSLSKLDQIGQTKTLRKKLFGLAKGFLQDIGPNNPLDYEQKYPPDKLGEELAGNARVWLTYLDEAGAYDRDKVEGWKDTVDVLLVFAGLFSGVITTFISQASQSLQQDYTQVSASLLFEMVQLQRAQFNGTPISNVPASTLTPTSPFKPSKNGFLVNGLWFTSLAISLATALVAVLAKQWLYYYMSATPGTALEKVRVRHFRFRGLEAWKVGLIIDLLPVFLHLALGIFLVGVIIFLFPLDDRIAWTIAVITGITYTLYFISVILPIRYPDCPYTTSLATFVGNAFYFLSSIVHLFYNDKVKSSPFIRISRLTILYWKNVCHEKISHLEKWWRKYRVTKAATATPPDPTPSLRVYVNKTFQEHFTNRREKNLNRAVSANANFIDLKALEWLNTISSNISVRRIIARGVSPHSDSILGLASQVRDELAMIDRFNENHISTDVQELRHRLCMALQRCPVGYTGPVSCYKEEERENQLDEECQKYIRVADAVNNDHCSVILTTALIEKNLKLPLTVWHCILTRETGNTAVVACILTFRQFPFQWRPRNYPRLQDRTYETGDVSFEHGDLDKLVFNYLFGYFCHDEAQPDFSDWYTEPYAHCCLFISIYRNLTSHRTIITDEVKKKDSLKRLFEDFKDTFSYYDLSPGKQLAFFKDILCVISNLGFDHHALWSRWRFSCRMFGGLANILDRLARDRFLFTRCQYEDISFICDHFSRDLSHIPVYDGYDGMHCVAKLLFMPQNRAHLLKKLSDPDFTATASDISLLSNCFYFLNLLAIRRNQERTWRSKGFSWIEKKYMYPNLMYLFRLNAKHPTGSTGSLSKPLVGALYHLSVLIKAWKYHAYSEELDKQEFFQVIKSRLDSQQSKELHARMLQVIQREQHPDILIKSADEFERTSTVNHFPSPILNLFEVPGLFSRVLSCRPWRIRRDNDVEMSVTQPEEANPTTGYLPTIPENPDEG